MKHYLIPSLFIVGILASCNPKPSTSSQNDLEQIAEPSVDKALEKGVTNEFAERAALGNLMEIESSAHMIKLTENPDVQNLATIMVKDHGMTQQELSNIVKGEKITIPQLLNPDQRKVLAKLDSLQEDERNYYYSLLMQEEHQKAIALFEKASKTESNEKLKQFAAKKLPALQHHLAETERVLGIMKKIAGDKGDYALKVRRPNNN